MIRSSMIVFWTLFLSCITQTNGASATTLYFVQDGAGFPVSNIRKIDAAGGPSEILQTGLITPFDVAVDTLGGKIYWTDVGTKSIRRKNLDGSGGVEDLIVTGLNVPLGISVDPYGEKIYFADRSASAIKRADLDGGVVETLVQFAGSQPQNIALDLVHEKIYWSETAAGRINRSRLDGTGFETIFSGPDAISGLVVDPLDGFLYFANRSQQKIQRSALDGSAVEDVVTGLIDPPLDVAVDSAEQKVYWSFFNAIQRTNLDLTGGVETLIAGLAGSEHLSGVNGIELGIPPAVVPEPSTAVLLAIGMVGLVVTTRRG